MTIQKVKEILDQKLYERKTRGILEFTWAKPMADKAQESFQAARAKLKDIGITNVDIQPLSQRVMVVLTQDQEAIVTDIMTEKGFQLINTIFDPSKADGVPSWYNATLPHNR